MQLYGSIINSRLHGHPTGVLVRSSNRACLESMTALPDDWTYVHTYVYIAFKQGSYKENLIYKYILQEQVMDNLFTQWGVEK